MSDNDCKVTESGGSIGVRKEYVEFTVQDSNICD